MEGESAARYYDWNKNTHQSVVRYGAGAVYPTVLEI